jgi:hypothetical protein
MKSARFLAIGLGLLLEAGWSLAQDAPATARHAPAPARNVDFRRLIPSAPGTGTISGICFEDSNGNGLLDAGDRGFPGLSLLLIADVPAPLLGTIGGTTVSRADGTFEFHDIPFGKWIVVESVPDGYRPTGAAEPPGARVVLEEAHPSISGLLLGISFSGVSIGGTSFRDRDGDRLRQTSEPGVSGITMQVRMPTGQLVASTQTDSAGNFFFTRLPAGAYELTQILPAGLAQTLPGGDGTTGVTLNNGEGTGGLLFGNQEATGSISGAVFDDRNSSGSRDNGERGFAGIAVNLYDPYGILHRTVTDASGLFSFTSLPTGEFTVFATVPAGTLETAPPGSSFFAVILEDGGAAEGLLFGLYRPFASDAAPSVCGSVFLDRNGNAVIDGIDRPLSGISVVLTDSAGVSRTAISSVDGAFRFENLAPGNYLLAESIPAGFTETFPGSPTGGSYSYSFSLSQGEQKDGLLFLNR